MKLSVSNLIKTTLNFSLINSEAGMMKKALILMLMQFNPNHQKIKAMMKVKVKIKNKNKKTFFNKKSSILKITTKITTESK